MQIKELTKKSNLLKDTIRYYERIGLIDKPNRQSNGYRDYSTCLISQLKFIKIAQSVGFTLKQIKPALPFVTNPKPNCPYLHEALDKQLESIENKIESLNKAKIKIEQWKKTTVHCLNKDSIVQIF